MATSLPPAPGRLIDVGGYRLHAWIAGAEREGAAHAALLHSSVLMPAGNWMRVLPLVGAQGPALALDRAGYGWSDAAPPEAPRSPARVVAETRTLLSAAGFPPPWVLVGHSVGALYCLEHAYRHPDEVAGLVLLDPSHPRQMKVRGVPSLRRMATIYGVLGRVVGLPGGKGVGGLLREQLFGPVRASLTPDEWSMLLAQFQQPALFETAVREVKALEDGLRALDKPPGSLGAIPLLIIEAEEWFSSRSLGMRSAVRALRQEMLGLSSRAAYAMAPQTNHVTLPFLAAEQVAAAIASLTSPQP